MSSQEKKNKIGGISLSIAVLGMITFYILTFFVKKSILIHMFLAGFEAAVVGGIADWFAVTALFKEIPIPLIKKHTNIIVKSRDQLTKGIVSLVAEQWLSKKSILSKIRTTLSIPFLGSQLTSNKNQKFLINTIIKIMETLLKTSDIIELQRILKTSSFNLLNTSKINILLYKITTKFIKEKKYTKALEFCLDKLELALNSEVVLQELEQMVQNQIKDYKKNKNSLTKIIINVTQSVGGINVNSTAVKIQKSLCDFINELKNNTEHPVRLEIDRELLKGFSTKEGQDKINVFIEQYIPKIQNILLSEKNIEWCLEKLNYAVSNSNSNFNQKLKHYVTTQVNEVANNQIKLQNIQNLLMDNVLKIVNNNHEVIAQTVSNNLRELDDEELVYQIENKVGGHLQYIRLNGAIIGGIIGCFLFLLKLIFR